MNIYYYAFYIIIIFIKIVTSSSNDKPHIIFILADDLGWNDVGFHGSNQFPTPHIDALAYSGIILNRYYVTPICTPSRSALMTGKYPIHNGMQHRVLFGAEPRGLPLNQTLLPEYLKQNGYKTHIVGKWHLGHYRREYTPLNRGFDTHFGFWTGHQDPFDHTAVEQGYWGLDMRDNMEPAWSSHGMYNTELFTQYACQRIREHNTSEPLFLYVAHGAVHSGNPYDPLRAPDSSLRAVPRIQDINRWRFAAMMHQLDLSVGAIVTTLKEQNMLSDSIIIFSTDNGGPAAGFNLNAASNWPLRGVKNTLWEGGIRGVGLIWSPLLSKPGRISNQLMHISDWLPTLIGKASTNSSNLPEDLDGMDVWTSLSEDTPSPRTQILHNIDDIYEIASLTNGQWKIIKGSTYKGGWDGWYGPSGRTGNQSDSYQWSLVLKAAKRFGIALDLKQAQDLRAQAQVQCHNKNIPIKTECFPMIEPCLFNIFEDPCEMNNLANKHPEIIHELMDQLHICNETAVKPLNLPWDPKANPKLWDHTWTNFGDYK